MINNSRFIISPFTVFAPPAVIHREWGEDLLFPLTNSL